MRCRKGFAGSRDDVRLANFKLVHRLDREMENFCAVQPNPICHGTTKDSLSLVACELNMSRYIQPLTFALSERNISFWLDTSGLRQFMKSHGESESETQPPESPPKSGRAGRCFRLGAIILLLYLLAAYVLIPMAWKRQVRRHPELFDAPRLTHTSSGIPGDPVNVALLGPESDVIRALMPRNGILRTRLRSAAASASQLILSFGDRMKRRP